MSLVSLMDEQIVLSMLTLALLPPPLVAVMLVRFEEASTDSSVKLLPTSQLMLVLSWLHVGSTLPMLAL